METSIKSSQTKNNNYTSETNSIANSKFWENLEFNRFGIISMLILIIGCIGGVAASFGAHDDILKLGMIVFPTIISLALILGVAPMKLIIYVCSIAVVLDIIVLMF